MKETLWAASRAWWVFYGALETWLETYEVTCCEGTWLEICYKVGWTLKITYVL